METPEEVGTVLLRSLSLLLLSKSVGRRVQDELRARLPNGLPESSSRCLEQEALRANGAVESLQEEAMFAHRQQQGPKKDVAHCFRYSGTPEQTETAQRKHYQVLLIVLSTPVNQHKRKLSVRCSRLSIFYVATLQSVELISPGQNHSLFRFYYLTDIMVSHESQITVGINIQWQLFANYHFRYQTKTISPVNQLLVCFPTWIWPHWYLQQ